MATEELALSPGNRYAGAQYTTEERCRRTSIPKLPEFVKRLHELYASSAFVAKEKDNMQFLKTCSLCKAMSSEDLMENLQLKNIWNVFDKINVKKDLNPKINRNKNFKYTIRQVEEPRG